MELSISKTKGKTETIEVSDLAFGKEFNEDLVHQTVTAYLAGARQGTRAQKKSSRCIWWRPQTLETERLWSS